MRGLQLGLVFLATALWSFGQSVYDASPSIAPRAVLAAVARYYDFMDSNLKPWHLKVNYQLDNDLGRPSAQGTFEYWWASPKVYRSTWTRGNTVHSEWHTADGRSLSLTAGESLGIYEHWLKTALLSPLPTASDLDPGKSIVIDHTSASSGGHSRCFMIVPSEITEVAAKKLLFGTYPEYCINKVKPILLGYYQFGIIMVRCVNFVQFQGKSLPRELGLIEGSRELLSAKVESAETISGTDPAFIPAKDAIPVHADRIELSPAVASGLLENGTAPSKRKNGAQGNVILKTTIGPDGRVQDVRLVSAPSPSLALSAFGTLKDWKFKPYLVDGMPSVIETMVHLDLPLDN